MARSLSAPLIAALQAGTVYPALLVDIEWASGNTRFWSGVNDRAFLGNTFTAAGNLLAIGAVQESVELRANGITLTLNGVNPTVLSLALSQRRQGKPVLVYLALLDAADALLDAPILLFDGRVDVPTIAPGHEGATVSLTAESRMIDLQRARRSRYTQEDQEARYPGDLGFRFVKKIQNLRLTWGGQTVGGSRPTLTPVYSTSTYGPFDGSNNSM